MLFQKMNNSPLHAGKQTHIGPDLINDARYLFPPHNNSATNNTGNWYRCLFNDATSISDQTVSNKTTMGVHHWAEREKGVAVAQDTTPMRLQRLMEIFKKKKPCQDSRSVRGNFEPGPSE